MSKSLALVGGDLAIQNRSFQTVSGKDKLFQDLKCQILEPLGSDPATPTYGSTIEDTIGGVTTPELLLNLKAELTDLLERYQSDQLEKIQEEIIRYSGQTTLDPDEVVKSIDAIDIVQSFDTIILRITITTIGDTQFQFILPLQQG
jgi:phage baseplate assembly protein W